MFANNPDTKVLLKWIPAHIGLVDHDYAKNAVIAFHLYKNPVPQDILNTVWTTSWLTSSRFPGSVGSLE